MPNVTKICSKLSDLKPVFTFHQTTDLFLLSSWFCTATYKLVSGTSISEVLKFSHD